MKFFKYQGTGNDFLVVDARQGRPAGLDQAAVRRICDRHFGVGGDGILLVEKGNAAPWFMRVLNSDGSEAEMCGNGIRCVAKFIAEHLGHDGDVIDIETPGGVRTCRLFRDADGMVATVTVSMGSPKTDRTRIPMAGEGPSRDVVAHVGDRRFVGSGVNMGNPHFVIFDYLEGREADTFGSALSSDPLFPLGANVEFVERIGGNHLRLTVYERGCGLTLACGTGASATVVAAVNAGLVNAGVPVRVDLPGGPLEITVSPDMSAVVMNGPATEVFDGEIDIAAI